MKRKLEMQGRMFECVMCKGAVDAGVVCVSLVAHRTSDGADVQEADSRIRIAGSILLYPRCSTVALSECLV